MRANDQDAWLAGVDGCTGGWLAVFARPAGTESRIQMVPRFADILNAPEQPVIIAVDMPIGLPERVGAGGRAAENAVRPCSAPGNPRCSRCRRGRRSMPPTTARLAGSRRRRPTRHARCRSSFSTLPRRSARWTRPCADQRGARVRGPPRTGLLEAQRRACADRAEEGEGPALRPGADVAPKAADRRGPAGPNRQGTAPERRGRRRSCSMRLLAPPSHGGYSLGPRSRFQRCRNATRSDW